MRYPFDKWLRWQLLVFFLHTKRDNTISSVSRNYQWRRVEFVDEVAAHEDKPKDFRRVRKTAESDY